MKRALLLTFALTVLSACADEVPPGIVLGRALVTACPVAAANDAAAREACADALTDMTELRDALTDPVLWGGQPDGFHAADLLTDASLTQFDPRVWRRMYLSTFMFEAAPHARAVPQQARCGRLSVSVLAQRQKVDGL
jgi:hypothetical protein